jgi:hypothetical protein
MRLPHRRTDRNWDERRIGGHAAGRRDGAHTTSHAKVNQGLSTVVRGQNGAVRRAANG